MGGWEFWVVAVIAAVLTGVGKGGLPMVGTLVVPVLSLVMPPVTAAGLILPVYVLSDWFGLYAYRKEFDGRVLAISVVGLTIGVGIGWAIARFIPENWVTVMLGVIAVVFSLNQLLRKPVIASPGPASVAPGLFWCSIAGFTSFVAHAGGPPYQVWTLPLGLRKAVFAGTSTIAFAYINAVKLVPFYFLGEINLESLETAIVLMPIAAASVFFGVWAVRRLPEKLFFRFVTWSLLVIGADLIGKGITGVEPMIALVKLFA
ncbi:TSUP family transporter [bacterium]|nr:TSUP family transporter [bacterium]